MKETWPGADERLVVEEMICNQHSKYWEECYKFVKHYVYVKAKNIPNNLWDDMVQEIMVKVAKYLPQFRFQCALTTWVNQIIEHRIIDEYRKLQNVGPYLPFSDNSHDEIDSENQEPNANGMDSAEDAFEMQEKIRIGMAALQEYANTHSNPTRNRQIIHMILFEGKTHEEAAIAVGCNPPVVGYVVREAQRHAREKWYNYL